MNLSIDPFLHNQLAPALEDEPEGTVFLAEAVVVDQMISYRERYRLGIEAQLVELWVNVDLIDDWRLALHGEIEIDEEDPFYGQVVRGRVALLEYWKRRPPYILHLYDLEPGDLLDGDEVARVMASLNEFFQQFVIAHDEDPDEEARP